AAVGVHPLQRERALLQPLDGGSGEVDPRLPVGLEGRLVGGAQLVLPVVGGERRRIEPGDGVGQVGHRGQASSMSVRPSRSSFSRYFGKSPLARGTSLRILGTGPLARISPLARAREMLTLPSQKRCPTSAFMNISTTGFGPLRASSP